VWAAVAGVLWPVFPLRAEMLKFTRLDDSHMVAVFAVVFLLARVWPQPKLIERGIG
jgi:hypothetical protein